MFPLSLSVSSDFAPTLMPQFVVFKFLPRTRRHTHMTSLVLSLSLGIFQLRACTQKMGGVRVSLDVYQLHIHSLCHVPRRACARVDRHTPPPRLMELPRLPAQLHPTHHSCRHYTRVYCSWEWGDGVGWSQDRVQARICQSRVCFAMVRFTCVRRMCVNVKRLRVCAHARAHVHTKTPTNTRIYRCVKHPQIHAYTYTGSKMALRQEKLNQDACAPQVCQRVNTHMHLTYVSTSRHTCTIASRHTRTSDISIRQNTCAPLRLDTCAPQVSHPFQTHVHQRVKTYVHLRYVNKHISVEVSVIGLFS